MKKRRVLLLFALIALFLFCLSCASSNGLIGRWQTEVEDEEIGKALLVYRFTDKGEIFLEQKQDDQIPFSIYFGTYHIDGDEVVIDDGTSSTRYAFTVDQNTLSFFLDGKRQITFERV